MLMRDDGLVDQVDRLVGEEAVGDVAVAEHRGGDQRGVGDADAVVRLVALLEPAQDRDRVLDRRLADVDRLEAPLERRVLLDVLLVLVERGGADRAQLAAGEHRLEQVGGVDGALGGAGADDRVQLVHEQDDLAVGLLDLLEDGLQALLELAAVLRAGDQRADVERDDAAVAQLLGHVAGDDALGEALGDRGLADAGLADQDGVVLGAAGEDLDDAADLVVAADDRVELAVLGGLREVAAELLERLVLVLGVLVGDAVRAADGLDGLDDVAPCSRRCGAAPRRRATCAAASASSRCSVETYSSLNWPSSRSAARRTATSSRLTVGSVAAPWMVGSCSSAALTSPRIASGRAPSLLRTGTTMPSSCSSRTASRCSGVASVWLRAAASAVAASSAPRDLVVNRSMFIGSKSQSGGLRL